MAGLRQASLVFLALLAATPAGARKKPPPPPVAIPAPPPPSVRAGVELWRGGDYPAAVTMWQPFAAAGDADAMFNLGQAYKLGRALPRDEAQARDWFRRAAVKGHRPAQANLGIMLFQAGEKAEAVRWLRAAADQDEMRAQYVLGVAYWNGDGAPRSLSLAYAYLTRAAALGLPEATAALSTLSARVSATERTDGGTVAASLAAGRGVPAAFETRPPITAPVAFASVDRPAPAIQPTAPAPVPAQVPAGTAATTLAAAMPAAQKPAPAAVTAPVLERAAPPPQPAPVPKTNPAPVPTVVASVAPAAIAPAAGPAAAKPPVSATVTPVPVKPPQQATALLAAKPEIVRPLRAAKPAWRVQLGAFSRRKLAEVAWKKLQVDHKQVVAGATPIYEANGTITKLQLGPYANEKAARETCARIAFSGSACFVTSG